MPYTNPLAKKTGAVPLVCLAFFLLVSAAAATDVQDPDAVREASTGVRIADLVSTNIDFESRAVFGPAFPQTVEFRALTKRAYLGFYNAFAIVNAGNPNNPSLVGWVDLPDIVRGISYEGGDYAYAAVSEAGLYVINVSNPASPTVEASYDTAGTALNVVRDGDTVYLADGASGLLIFDVTTPSAPALVGSYDTPGYAISLHLLGNTVFVADDGAGVQFINVTDPAAPTLLGSYDTAGRAYSCFWSFFIIGFDQFSYLYIADGPAGLEIVDVTDPAAPVSIGSYDTPDWAYEVVLTGSPADTAYVADRAGGLQVIDVSAPTAPTLLGSVATPGDRAWGLSVDLPNVYMTDYLRGLQVADVSTPASPVIVGSFVSPGAGDIEVDGDIAYTIFGVNAESTVTIVNTSVRERPRVIAEVPLDGFLGGVRADGDYLYVANTDRGLRILDVSEPAVPSVVSTTDTPGSAQGVDVAGSYAYVADGVSGLQVLDVSDPAVPTIVGTYATPFRANDVQVVGSYAYVADGTSIGSLQIIDVSNPAAPSLAGSHQALSWPAGVFVSGSYAYVADLDEDLQIFDVSNPAAPFWIGEFTTPGNFQDRFGDVFVVGDQAYVAAGKGGLLVVDVSAPWAPFEVGSFDTVDSASRVDFQGGYVYLADAMGGAYILHHVDQCFDDFEPNDDFLGAWPITAGTIYGPKICDAGDPDFFVVTTATGGTFDITMQPPPNQDYNLYLYDVSYNLIGASTAAGDATENIVETVSMASTYFVEVRGHAGDNDPLLPYSLFYVFRACPAPTQAVYIATATLDPNLNVVLHIQDPNQPSVVTGYNVYRATHPAGPYPLHAENIVDMQEAVPDIQFVDVGSNDGGSYYYRVNAVNGFCGAEGPQ